MVQHPVRPCACLVAVIALLAAGGCQSTERSGHGSRSAPRSGDARHEISSLLDQYTQALLKKDVAALDRIWADDLSFINPRGELLGKRDRMDNLRTGATAFKAIELTEKRVRVYGDAAVATCQVALQAQYSGQEGSGKYRVTTVWVRPDHSWRMTAVQMTPITP